MTQSQPLTVTYCIVPRDLAGELHDHLREQWRDDPSIEVIVERRAKHRRGADRRRRPGTPPGGVERRAVRNPQGRRVAERRAAKARVLPRPLPAKARPHANRFLFVQRRLPSGQAAEDVATARLVVEYQIGDRSALEDIYLRYFDRVYAYARMALRDPQHAEEVTQQVFARVVEALPGYELRRGATFRAWLFRVARSTILDARVSPLRAEPLEPAAPEAAESPAPSYAARDALDWLTDAELYRFVERLPASQREVLVMRYLLDMSPREVATAMHRTPQAVGQLLVRALRTVEARIGGGRGSGGSYRSAMLVRARGAPVLSARRLALHGDSRGSARGADLASRARPLAVGAR
jgi:RNA polymerase sigma-70 factor (ECF subfamily)